MNKICTNCIHCEVFEFRPSLSTCERPVGKISPVTGAPGKHRWTSCNVQREDGFILSQVFKTCGKRGRFFEAKTR